MYMHTYLYFIYFVDDVLIFINMPGRRLTLKAKPSDTMWDIKTKIEVETGISVYNQELKVAGNTLPLLDSYLLSTRTQLTLDLENKLCG